MALLKDRPCIAVSANIDPTGSTHIDETAPMGCTVTYEFPARDKLPACRLFWYERRQPDIRLFLGQKPNPKASGFLIIGSRGTMLSEHDYGGTWRLLSAAAASPGTPKRCVPSTWLPPIASSGRSIARDGRCSRSQESGVSNPVLPFAKETPQRSALWGFLLIPDP